MNDYGRRLYEFRKRHELTQAQMAKLAGMDTSYFVMIENGKKYPAEKTQKKLEKIIKNH